MIRLVLREAMMLLAAGLAIGIGLALWAGPGGGQAAIRAQTERRGDVRGGVGVVGRGGGGRGVRSGAAGVGMDPMDALRVE